MSYIEKHLMPGEQIVHRTQLHWSLYIWPIIWLAVAICCFVSGKEAAIGFGVLDIIFIVPLTALAAWIARRSSEFAVTNMRVLIKTGLIRRHSLETLLSKIESIGVSQGILGRILDFGSIVVSGTGGSKEPFHRIADPMQFRLKVQEQIAAMEERRDARRA